MAGTTKSTPNLKLRHERERRCWSQLELADMLGTTPLNVGRWERGITFPGPHLRQKLCEVFEKSAQELGLVPAYADPPTSPQPSQTPQPADAPYSSASPQTPLCLWNVPYSRNTLFTGREDILQQLRQALTLEDSPIALAQPQAISGLGGIGKTQTAVEYAYRYRNQYEAVLWVRADSYDSLVSDFLLIATLLCLPQRNENDQSMIIQAVIHWFDTHNNWLLILDNADDIAMVSACIPSAGKGHVVLTTRAHSTGTTAQRIELDNMGVEEGIVLLLRRAKILKGSVASMKTINEGLRSQAQAIVEAVDGLPLALDQAGAYIEETGCSLADYLKFYKTRRTRLLRMRGKNATGHPEPVATTWSLSFEKIESANPAAAELLRLCAFLHPDAIPEAMIVDGAVELGPILQPLVEDEFELNEAIGELRKYSLIKRDPELKLLNVHRLVQSVLKDAMDKELQREWAERTVHMMNRVFPEVEFATWSLCQQYLPHAQVCVNLIEQWDMTFAESARLLNNAGHYLQERAQFTEAELFLHSALTKREQVLGAKHPAVAETLDNIAQLYSIKGNYGQAEVLFQRALMIFEQSAEAEKLNVATILNHMGQLYQRQGKYAQAEMFHEQSLTIRRQILGDDHIDLAQTLNDLADVYEIQGMYTKAGSLFQQALIILERVVGPEHPLTITCLDNVGVVYYRLGKYAEAESYLIRSLTFYEQVMGRDHPETAMGFFNLAITYYAWGKYKQAEPLFLQALAIWEETLGFNHPYVASALNALAKHFSTQGRYVEAEAFFQRALTIREQLLGTTHLEVALSLHGLGVLYYKQGKYTEAEQLLKRTLTIREQIAKPASPLIAQTFNDLAYLYNDLGRSTEAEQLFRQALIIEEQALGPVHPDIAYSLNGLARLYIAQNQYEYAEPLLKRVLAIYEQSLVPEHPQSVLALKDYAILLQKMGRKAEKAQLQATQEE